MEICVRIGFEYKYGVTSLPTQEAGYSYESKHTHD